MGTNAPPSRKTHITRIFGTNKDKERLEHIWADLERMDVVKSALQLPSIVGWLGLQWQGLQRKFRWSDDPNADDYEPDGTPSRNLETLKVCDPENEDDVNDPEEWIPLKVVKAIRQRVETGTETNGGTAMDRFLNAVTDDELTTARVVEVRKIPHYDTNYDDIVQAAADASPDLKEYVIPAEDYTKDLSTKDEDQYVEHEIITYLKHKGNAGEVSGIGRQTKLLNEYLIDGSEPPKGDVTGNNGINPPYRLDPYQNIINISFAINVIVVFVAAQSCEIQPDPKTGKEKAKFLDRFDGAPFGDCQAFKVPANAGVFMKTRLPGSSGDPTVLRNVYVLVFALKGTADESLARAKSATLQALHSVATAALGDLEVGTIPVPEGLLWWAGSMIQSAPDSVHIWKMRYGKHRDDNNPRNVMVQCYPISVTPTSYLVPEHTSLTFHGYRIYNYRLDRRGEKQVYIAGDHITNPSAWTSAVIGHISIPPVNEDDPGTEADFHGVGFADEPPLLDHDRPQA